MNTSVQMEHSVISSTSPLADAWRAMLCVETRELPVQVDRGICNVAKVTLGIPSKTKAELKPLLLVDGVVLKITVD